MSKKIIFNTGDKIGECIYIKDVEKKSGRRIMLFTCKCGNEFKSDYQNVRSLKSKTCGCEKYGRYRKHGFTSNLNKSSGGCSEFSIWSNMRQRCYNKKVKNFDKYGGRGISVCDRWNESFENFLNDMGFRPTKGHSIERINNNGNYEPSNCKWATRTEQNNNTSRNNYITYKGETKTLSQWARVIELSPKLLGLRLRRKWTIEKAFETPIRIFNH